MQGKHLTAQAISLERETVFCFDCFLNSAGTPVGCGARLVPRSFQEFQAATSDLPVLFRDGTTTKFTRPRYRKIQKLTNAINAFTLTNILLVGFGVICLISNLHLQVPAFLHSSVSRVSPMEMLYWGLNTPEASSFQACFLGSPGACLVDYVGGHWVKIMLVGVGPRLCWWGSGRGRTV